MYISVNFQNYLPSSSYLHFGNHLSSEENGDNRVSGEGYVSKQWIILKCLWSVHANGNQTNKCTKPEYSSNLHKKRKQTNNS